MFFLRQCQAVQTKQCLSSVCVLVLRLLGFVDNFFCFVGNEEAALYNGKICGEGLIDSF